MDLLISLPVLLFSVILHEYAHGWMAEKFGDDTARIMGRLTFNPVPHIDFFGTIILPAVAIISGAPIFGWAKPVPVNPYRLNNPHKDMVWVSLAGPLSNIMLAVGAAFVMWGLRLIDFQASGLLIALYQLAYLTMLINIILPVFNLFPVPPLDGSKVVMGILPPRLAFQYAQLEPYGFFIIIILLSTGFFGRVLGPIVSFFVYALSGRGF
ncbi:MAG: site-2 protease family protein [Endomicrobiales bacterium]|nr:site-2 protease family protein [Endomicrobiales bacterium]